jgi:predicted nuclease of restriction endonuclease-like (RecB) superfamily
MNFSTLIQSIQNTHLALQQQAVKAINRALTIRNWLIGFYIVEFEQNGEDRAVYGDKLLHQLSLELQKQKVSNTNERELRRYRLFYNTYPQLRTVILQSGSESNIRGTVFPEFIQSIWGTVSPQIKNVQVSNKPSDSLGVPADQLISRLSFSHIAELLPIDDPLKRTFYEVEAIKGTWGVRELRRQINSLYYERCGLSNNPEKLSALVAGKAETLQPEDVIKSVYTFEFLGLKAKEVIEEKDLETALLDHLQEFILELGRGFCFEARQQRIVIGDEYFFIDLVFYHRILKCHVLIELKVEAFSHANGGQLNTYLNYYKAEVMEAGDNPPVGILLVTNKNDALVQYATAGMDKQLFVQKYQVVLPTKEQLEAFIKEELKNVAH